MNEISTFTSDKQPLQDILKSIARGEIQLPEFQRGWVWDDEHIRSLMASISLSYPIGAIMTLENGNPDVRFKPRPVEGVKLNGDIEPEHFILDGQQRLTSLYQALSLNEPVKTRDNRKKEILRWYYIDMEKALNPHLDREDALISLPEDRIIKRYRNEAEKDYSTPQAEYENLLFPVSNIFDPADWRREFNLYWQHDVDKSRFFDLFERRIIECFKQYQVPMIILRKSTPKLAVCQVFEKVNTGGVSLTVFELITASFAADGFNLREDWEGKFEKGIKVSEGRKDVLHKQQILQSVGADELLQVIALLTTYERKQADSNAAVSCKRNEILKLVLSEYQKWDDTATNGFIKAGKLLFHQNFYSNRDLSYGTQLVPLSSLLALLGDKADNDAVREKLIRWFWCGVFGELYGSAVETRMAKDLLEVSNWIDGADEPSTVLECNFVPARLYTLRTRNSAAYKGLYALLMRDECLDFRTGEPIDVQTYFEDYIDVHHIFPRDWCNNNNVEPKFYNSIINKTPLAYRTNRIIGGNAPSIYLEKLREDTGITEERQNEILESHVIAVDALKSDDFWPFYEARKEALLQRIENATGKKITREDKGDLETVDLNESPEDIDGGVTL